MIKHKKSKPKNGDWYYYIDFYNGCPFINNGWFWVKDEYCIKHLKLNNFFKKHSIANKTLKKMKEILKQDI